MAEPRYIRKNFNAGEISPELRKRTDLQVYASAANSLKNVDVTPYGSADRRLPSRYLAEIDHSLYGIPIKYIPFKFNNQEVFHIVFTDNSGQFTENFTYAGMLVFNETGELIVQTPEGQQRPIFSEKFIEQSAYQVADVPDLHFIQVKDYIFFTCKGKYPVKSFNRYFNNSYNTNYFRLKNHTFNIEPFQDVNSDDSITLTSDLDVTSSNDARFRGTYSPTEQYSVGDVVTPLITQEQLSGVDVIPTMVGFTSRSGSTSRFQYDIYVKNVGLQIEFTSTGQRPAEGSTVYFDNVTIKAPGGATTQLNGPYTVTYQIENNQDLLVGGNYDYVDSRNSIFSGRKFSIEEINYKVTHSTSTSYNSGGLRITRSTSNPGPYNHSNLADTYAPTVRGSEGYSVQLNGIPVFSYNEFNNYASNYTSNIDNNLGNPLTDTASWNPGQLPSSSAMSAAGTTASDYATIAGGTITSSSPIFQIGCENEALRVQKDFQGIRRKVDATSMSSGGTNTSELFSAMGNVTLTTEGGSWDGIVELQESTDEGATFTTIGSVISESYSSNGSLDRTIFNPNAILRVRYTKGTSDSDPGEDGLNLTNPDVLIYKVTAPGPHFNYFRITQRINDRVVKVSPIGLVENFSNESRWSLGSFSERFGYPFAIAIHDERMVLGGTPTQPTTVFGSRINSWSDYTMGDNEDDPYQFTINSDTYDRVRSLRSSTKLMVFTESAEITMGASGDTDATISPTNIKVKTETKFGASKVQAVITADLAFFVQGDSERVRSSQFDFVTDKFLSSEVSLYAHHITESGIKEFAYIRNPYSVLYFLLNNGQMASFTYEKDQSVKGWARHFIGSAAEGTKLLSQIISIGGQFSEVGDYLALLTKRLNADGTYCYYLEHTGEEKIQLYKKDYQDLPYYQSDYYDGEEPIGYSVYGTDSTNATSSRQGTGYFYPVYEFNSLKLYSTIYNAETSNPGQEQLSDLINLPGNNSAQHSTLTETSLDDFPSYTDETNYLKVAVNNDDGNGFSALFKIQLRNTDGTDTAFDRMQTVYNDANKSGYIQFKVIFDHASLANAGATRARVGAQIIMGAPGQTNTNAPVNGTFLFSAQQIAVNSALGKVEEYFVIPFDQAPDTGLSTSTINQGFAAGANSFSIGINISTDPTTATGAEVYFDDFLITYKDTVHTHNFDNMARTFVMPNSGAVHASSTYSSAYPLHPESSLPPPEDNESYSSTAYITKTFGVARDAQLRFNLVRYYTGTSIFPPGNNGSGLSVTFNVVSNGVSEVANIKRETWRISSITINNGGQNYLVGQGISVTHNGFNFGLQQAQITIASVSTSGAVTGFTITSGGSYCGTGTTSLGIRQGSIFGTTPPVITLTAVNAIAGHTGGFRGAFIGHADFFIDSVDVIDGGYGYGGVAPTISMSSNTPIEVAPTFDIQLTEDGNSVASVNLNETTRNSFEGTGSFSGGFSNYNARNQQYGNSQYEGWGEVTISRYYPPTLTPVISAPSFPFDASLENAQNIVVNGFNDPLHQAALDDIFSTDAKHSAFLEWVTTQKRLDIANSPDIRTQDIEPGSWTTTDTAVKANLDSNLSTARGLTSTSNPGAPYALGYPVSANNYIPGTGTNDTTTEDVFKLYGAPNGQIRTVLDSIDYNSNGLLGSVTNSLNAAGVMLNAERVFLLIPRKKPTGSEDLKNYLNWVNDFNFHDHDNAMYTLATDYPTWNITNDDIITDVYNAIPLPTTGRNFFDTRSTGGAHFLAQNVNWYNRNNGINIGATRLFNRSSDQESNIAWTIAHSFYPGTNFTNYEQRPASGTFDNPKTLLAWGNQGFSTNLQGLFTSNKFNWPWESNPNWWYVVLVEGTYYWKNALSGVIKGDLLTAYVYDTEGE